MPNWNRIVREHLAVLRLPPDDPNITDQMWIDGARSKYKGRIIVGKDLLEI